MCAERSLLYYVQANRPGRTIRTMAIASAPSPRECTVRRMPASDRRRRKKRQQAPIRIVMSGAGRAIVVEEAKPAAAVYIRTGIIISTRTMFNPEFILYEDNHLIVVNKRSGELVQPDTTGDPALEAKSKRSSTCATTNRGNVFLGVVHRIDRPVSRPCFSPRPARR